MHVLDLKFPCTGEFFYIMLYILLRVNFMKDDFSKRVKDVLGNTKDYDVDLQFYLTGNCNLRCQGCYMKAGPNVSRDIIGPSDVNFYLNEFAKYQYI